MEFHPMHDGKYTRERTHSFQANLNIKMTTTTMQNTRPEQSIDTFIYPNCNNIRGNQLIC